MSYPPPQYPPGQYPQPPQYPPGQAPPQEQQAQRRGGCRGCLMGCLIATVVGVALMAIAVVAGVYVVRQMFPTTESVQQAASCAIMRVVVNNAESGIDQSDATAAEKAEMLRAVQELRMEFDRQCDPLTELRAAS